MRFLKGSKVEVLQEAEVPLCSWRGAEIVLGNAQSFYVRYDPSPVDSGVTVERVSRRLIRPCLSQDDPVRRASGNIFEAFDNYSWKIAEMDSTRCFGCSFRGQPECGNFGSKLSKHRKNHNAFEGVISRGMKRKSSAMSTYPTQFCETTKRLQTPHQDGRHSLQVAGVSPHLSKEVDAVDSSCFMLGEKYTHASLNRRKNGVRKINLAGVNSSDTESISSSVGSCSPSSSSKHFYSAYQSGDICSRTDDVEASMSERETSQHDKNIAKEETHLLELNAYRATMLALYICGSISWEQEALLTNLRLTLNISTNEHIAELRNLISSAVISI
ncbi:hypothetical protein ABZP36_020557 [Zizania latifolia]